MLPLYKSHIRPLIELSSCVWNVGFVGDMKLLQGVQRRWTNVIDGLSDVSYGTRLYRLDL